MLIAAIIILSIIVAIGAHGALAIVLWALFALLLCGAVIKAFSRGIDDLFKSG